MPFREKTAWIMTVALIIGGGFYFAAVSEVAVAADLTTLPLIPILIAYVMIIVLVAIIGHGAAAISTPNEANTPIDERERDIIHRAAHWGGTALAGSILLSLGVFLLSGSGVLLFHAVLASLMLGQLADYAAQIILFRTGP